MMEVVLVLLVVRHPARIELDVRDHPALRKERESDVPSRRASCRLATPVENVRVDREIARLEEDHGLTGARDGTPMLFRRAKILGHLWNAPSRMRLFTCTRRSSPRPRAREASRRSPRRRSGS